MSKHMWLWFCIDMGEVPAVFTAGLKNREYLIMAKNPAGLNIIRRAIIPAFEDIESDIPDLSTQQGLTPSGMWEYTKTNIHLSLRSMVREIERMEKGYQ